MKYSIYMILILMLVSCMCTPKPDSVRIVGLLLSTDTNYTKGSQSVFVIKAKADKEIQEASKQICLTYNKLQAADIHKNKIVPSTINLICDKKINDVEPGQNLDVMNLISEFEMTGIIQDQQLIKNEVYNFSLSCKTTDSLSFNLKFNLRTH